MLKAFVIGQPLPIGHNGQEGTTLEFTPSGMLLIVAFNQPTASEIAALQSGDVQMSLYIKDGIIFMLSKFGSLNWMDSPFNVRLYDDKQVGFDWSDDIKDGTGWAMQINLIDVPSTIIKTNRLIGCSTQFSRELRRAILAQTEQPFNAHDYRSKLQSIYANLTTDDMVRRSMYHFKIKR